MCLKALIQQVFCPVLLMCGLHICPLKAQKTSDNTVKWLGREFATPGVQGMSPGKGLSIERSDMPSYRLNSSSKDSDIGNGISQVDNHERIKLNLRLPLWNSGGLKAILGFKYSNEELVFESPNQLDYELHRSLEQRNLKSIGTNLLVLKPFRGDHYLVLRGSMSFNGEYEGLGGGFQRDFLNYSVSALFGYKKNEDTEMGIGVNFNNSFGINSIYPVILYNHNFRENWGIEALLPKRLALRHNLNSKSIISAVTELEGANYFIPEIQYAEDRDATEALRMEIAELKAGVSYQRELLSMLWFGVDVGYRKNLRFDFARSFYDRRQRLVESDVPRGFYTNISLFITPPRKFSKR